MADKLQIQNEKVVLTTDEGLRIERPAADIAEMFRRELLPPLNGSALPDGVKFVEWREPFLLIVHQLPWQVRRLRWIDNNSPAEYGPGTTYRNVRLSVPYAITFAVFCHRGGRLYLTDANEMYFRNSPLTSKNDRLGFPALLNISRIPTGKRERAWICTQYLHRGPQMSWTQQLTSLLDHTWNGGFNRSSEHHEGSSWYGYSLNVHPNLHPVEKWEEATAQDEAFGVSVPWKEVPHTVGELIDGILDEQRTAPTSAMSRFVAPQASAGIVTRFINFAQKCTPKRKSRSTKKTKSKQKT